MTRAGNHLDQKDGKYLWDLKNPHGYGNRMGDYRTRIETEFLFRHLPPAPQRVLDVGGGAGRLGAVLQSRGHQVTVLDKNPQAITLAREKGLEQVVVSDILDYNGTGFDVVVCMEVLEYFKDCAPVIAKCAGFTKPGGVFVFCIINSGSWRFKLQQMRKDHSDATGFSRAEIEAQLRKNNFEIIGQRGFQWSLARTGSDSRVVTVSSAVERGLGLGNWLGQSPWLLYAGRKI